MADMIQWWLIDAVGRRRLFISMALGMALALIAEAICVNHGGHDAGIAAVFFVFLFEGFFTWGWMSTAFVYPAEILPLKIRAKGTAIAVAADFLGNFLVVEITPPAIENIGYKTYIIFAVFNVISAMICWFFYPETAGLSLESIDSIFIRQPDDDSGRSDDSWHRKVKWNVIAKSHAAVQEVRKRRRALRSSGGDMEVAIDDGLNRVAEKEGIMSEHIN